MNPTMNRFAFSMLIGFLTGCFPVEDQMVKTHAGSGYFHSETRATPKTRFSNNLAPVRAVAVIHPTSGNTASGIVVFTQTDDGLRVEASLSGLTPGRHGFHIHEFGDCSAPDAMSAGGHFNPEDEPHGGPGAVSRHAGDMGNVTADESGNATLVYLDDRMSLRGPHAIIGRAVIVHAEPDDLSSQPTGAAGARIGCGVIGAARELIE